ncbi:hypothetical protein PAXRUDRAFT_38981, partial [Paxillus rubicundulus Ve08.2h10]
VTGLSIRHIGERFQWSNNMISRHLFSFYPFKILNAFSHHDIYNKYVRLPHVNDPTPPEILHDPRFYPAFQSAISAIDGTHIICCPSAAERDASHNRK